MSYGFGGLAGAGYVSSGSLSFGSGAYISTQGVLDSMERDREVSDRRMQYDIEDTTRNGSFETDVNKFSQYLEEGKEDKALKYYYELLEDMKKYPEYSSLDDKALQVQAMKIIEAQLTKQNDNVDVDLEEYIKKHAANSGERHHQLNCTFDDSIVDDTTEEDLLNIILGMDEDKKDHELYGIGAGASVVGGFFASIHNWIWGRQSF